MFTQRISLPTPVEWRNLTFSKLGNFSELSRMPWSELERVEIFPGCVLGSECLVVPEDWLAMNPTRYLASRTIRPADLGTPSSQIVASRQDESLRRALLALWLPGMTSTGLRQWNPRTWLTYSNMLMAVAYHEISLRDENDGTLFQSITTRSLTQQILPAMNATAKTAHRVDFILRRLINSGQRGIISDWPHNYYMDQKRSAAPTIEGIEIDAPELLFRNPSIERNWQPFSDRFVIEFITRTTWILENIAAQTIALWLELQSLKKELNLSNNDPRLDAARRAAMSRVEWVDKNGNTLTELPFVLNYTSGETSAWPPLTSRDISRVTMLVQSSIIGLIALCTGARASEIAAAKDTEMQGTDDRLFSRTFKFSDRLGGKDRDWPLHPLVARALSLQQTLSRGVRPEGTDHLWVMSKQRIGDQLLGLTEPQVLAVDFLKLSHLTGSDRAHLHRWRHTVARLIAIAVTSAPQVIMDLFGHSSLKNVLTYMCSHRDIVEDAQRVAKDMAAIITGNAIMEVTQGKTSGAASGRIALALNQSPMRRGETEFATKDLSETIKVLTFNEIEWKLVRPGVLCTKTERQFGPCTRSRGTPDPGSCRTTCDHRLETERAKRDCRSILATLVNERKNAIDSGEVMLVARLDGEIRSNLERWPELRAEFVASHPTLNVAA